MCSSGAFHVNTDLPSRGAGWAGEMCGRETRCRPNGVAVKLRGQGPHAEADAAHGVHACESRDAGRAPPSRFDLTRRFSAGPKPGRVGFYGELGGTRLLTPTSA